MFKRNFFFQNINNLIEKIILFNSFESNFFPNKQIINLEFIVDLK